MKKLFAIFILILQLTMANSQESNLVGTWQGTLLNGDNEEVWKLKIKILSANSAELYLYDANEGVYLNYITAKKFNNYKRNITFNANGNFGVMTVSYSSKNSTGQSVYNLQYNEESGYVNTIWTNLNNPIEGNMLASATLISDKVMVYNKSDISIGGKSFDYLGISSIEMGDKSTKVSIKITNTKNDIFKGTFHEPTHNTAFYLTDASRSKKYKLTGANVNLPYQLAVKEGESETIILYFEPLPKGTKTFNIMENGAADNTNLWKFYDVFVNK